MSTQWPMIPASGGVGIPLSAIRNRALIFPKLSGRPFSVEFLMDRLHSASGAKGFAGRKGIAVLPQSAAFPLQSFTDSIGFSDYSGRANDIPVEDKTARIEVGYSGVSLDIFLNSSETIATGSSGTGPSPFSDNYRVATLYTTLSPTLTSCRLMYDMVRLGYNYGALKGYTIVGSKTWPTIQTLGQVRTMPVVATFNPTSIGLGKVDISSILDGSGVKFFLWVLPTEYYLNDWSSFIGNVGAPYFGMTFPGRIKVYGFEYNSQDFWS